MVKILPLFLILASTSVHAGASFVSPFDNSDIEMEKEIVYIDKTTDVEYRPQSDASDISSDQLQEEIRKAVQQALAEERRNAELVSNSIQSTLTEQEKNFRYRIEINGKRLMFDEENNQYIIFKGVE